MADFVIDYFHGTTGTFIQNRAPTNAAGTVAGSVGDWVKHATATQDIEIDDFGETQLNGAGNGLYHHVGTPAGAEYDIVARTRAAGTGSNIFVWGRFDPATGNGYRAGFVRGATATWRIHKVVSGSISVLASVNVGPEAGFNTFAELIFEIRDSRKTLKLRNHSGGVADKILVEDTSDNTIIAAGKVAIQQETTFSGDAGDYRFDWIVASDAAGGGGDVTPPTIDSVTPADGFQAAQGSTTIAYTATTNEVCTANQTTSGVRWGTTPGQAFNDKPNLASSADGLTHTFTVTGLSDGSSGTVYIQPRDNAGNTGSEVTRAFSVSTGAGQAPVISGGPLSGVKSPVSSINFSRTTNIVSEMRWSTSPGAAWASMTAFTTTGGTSHSTSITVSPGINNIYIRARNESVDSAEQTNTFQVAPASAMVGNQKEYTRRWIDANLTITAWLIDLTQYTTYAPATHTSIAAIPTAAKVKSTVVTNRIVVSGTGKLDIAGDGSNDPLFNNLTGGQKWHGVAFSAGDNIFMWSALPTDGGHVMSANGDARGVFPAGGVA